MKKAKTFKLLSFVLALVILMSFAACTAAPAGSEGLAYSSNKDGTCSVTGLGDCKDSDIVIPAKSPAGDRVTSIGKKAFSECDTITSIVIPSSVTTIEREAFYKCSALTSVEIPDGVTKIGTEAFRYCSSLESIRIPEGVTEISWLCFHSCDALKSITIPSTVTKIDALSLADCSSLERITVAPGNPEFYSENNCIIKTATKTLLRGCKTSVIPTDGSVTIIGSNAFSFCENLTEISLPGCITDIGNDAFNYCTSLTEFTVPDGVTKIPEKAFHHCDSLVTLTLPGSITRIDPGALGECISLTEIRFDGTMEQWWGVEFGEDWNPFSGDFIVKCTDGNT